MSLKENAGRLKRDRGRPGEEISRQSRTWSRQRRPEQKQDLSSKRLFAFTQKSYPHLVWQLSNDPSNEIDVVTRGIVKDPSRNSEIFHRVCWRVLAHGPDALDGADIATTNASVEMLEGRVKPSLEGAEKNQIHLRGLGVAGPRGLRGQGQRLFTEHVLPSLETFHDNLLMGHGRSCHDASLDSDVGVDDLGRLVRVEEPDLTSETPLPPEQVPPGPVRFHHVNDPDHFPQGEEIVHVERTGTTSAKQGHADYISARIDPQTSHVP